MPGSSMVTKPKRKATGAAAMGPGPGRPKGCPNKITRDFRETVRLVLEDNADNVGLWLKTVAEGSPEQGTRPDPGRALDLMAKIAEYAAPKLNRTEHVGNNEQPVRLEFSWKSSESK